ncbi:PP2C family protein-serine/threonine phosphatase, partial [Streptacidiphilus griseoplanus]|uniref:PP2C family protein-serine/threonine phosphatase n=1 Tax=Peterkaempfera griseoplana TaxID=66896 RepID=UPI0014703CC0
MAAHGGGGPPGAGKPPHVPRHIMPWLLALPTTLLLVDVLTPPPVRLGPVMISAPVFAAVFCGPLRTLIVAAVTLCCIVLAGFHDEMLGTSNFTVQLAALLLITSAAVGAGSVRSRREQQLAQVRWVAEATQRVLLQPLPARLGSLTVASLYLAADDEAAIGGDLYAASRHGRTSRVLVGDAEGKGLAAAGVVSCVLSAFRRSSRRHTTLPEAAAYLEQALTDELVEIELSARSSTGPLGAERPAGEGFVTAVIVDFPDGTDQVHVLNRAHPPPLIVRDGEVLALTPVVPSLPLGLGDLFNG